jgi:DNA topoisomerase-1
LDRIIGFSLSKLLQKKIGSKSAGRVQSVALKLIVDREKEIKKFDKQEYWDLFVHFTKKSKKLKAKLEKYNDEKVEIKSEKEALEIESNLSDKYLIKDIVRKEKEKAPKPPFITSTLQQEASNKYNFNARKTMQIAQSLYEGVELGKERVGLITYMRTDSTRLSDEFISSCKNYIIKEYGEDYYCGVVVSKKGKNIQDAHEAIRPSKISYNPESIKKYLTNDEYKLYSMIYDRAVSSLMSKAKVLDEKVIIENNGYTFELNGEKSLFDGYLKVFNKLDISYLLTTNLSVFLLSVVLETLYSLLFINKFNYFFVAIFGLLIGVVICFIVKGLLVEEYLFIVTFTSFALTFLTYNIYFDNKNEKMVKDNKEV